MIESFGTWLAQQTGQRGPVGDLADFHVSTCSCQPCLARPGRPESIGEVRHELEVHGATAKHSEGLSLAVKAWREGIGSAPVRDERLSCVECGSDRLKMAAPTLTKAPDGALAATTPVTCSHCLHSWRVVLRLEGSSLGGTLRLLVYP